MTWSRREHKETVYTPEISAACDEYLDLCRSGVFTFSAEDLRQYQKDHVSPECRRYLEKLERNAAERKRKGMEL